MSAVESFMAAMQAAGIRPVEPLDLSAGKLVRFRCDGDRPGRANGWAVLHLDDRPAGTFGHHRLGIRQSWSLGGDSAPVSPAKRRRLRQQWDQTRRKNEQKRAALADEAARTAVDLWRRSTPARADHPYVVRKRLDASRLRQIGDDLLIPMLDGEADFRNMQRIKPDGSKRYLKGGATAGLWFYVSERPLKPGDVVIIAEGYATAAAIHRATGFTCIVAFSAANLKAVGLHFKSFRPDQNYIVAADDDDHLERNIGLERATAAARAIGATLAIPPKEAPHG